VNHQRVAPITTTSEDFRLAATTKGFVGRKPSQRSATSTD